MKYKNELAEILSMLLGLEVEPEENISMQSCNMWDSMKHIEIITTVEEEFGVSFDIEDIPKLTSYNLILEKLNELK